MSIGRRFSDRITESFLTVIVGVLSLCTIVYSLTNLKDIKTIKKRRITDHLIKNLISIAIAMISLGLIIYTIITSGL